MTVGSGSVRKALEQIFEIDSSAKRVVPMEGLRGFAVLLVFFVHYFTLSEPWTQQGTVGAHVATALRNLGHSGVDLFFVLSGFLIYGMLITKKRPFIPYFKRRIQRIYPTFICVFLVYVCLSWIIPSEGKIPQGVWAGASYIAANLLLLPGVLPIEPLITVAWSLSYEMFCYLVIPFAIVLFAMRRWESNWRAMSALLVGAAILIYAWNFGGHVRFAMFASGIFLHETLRTISPRRADQLGFAGLVGSLVCITLISELDAYPPLRFIVLFFAFYALCYGSFAANGICARLFSYAPLRWLGNMSYSYYLSHGLALKALFMALGRVLPPHQDRPILIWGLLPFAVITTLGVSTVLFVLVEKRFSLAPSRPQRLMALPESAASQL